MTVDCNAALLRARSVRRRDARGGRGGAQRRGHRRRPLGGHELPQLRQPREARGHVAVRSRRSRGIRDACLALGTPVVSGNVSFYNETDGQARSRRRRRSAWSACSTTSKPARHAVVQGRRRRGRPARPHARGARRAASISPCATGSSAARRRGSTSRPRSACTSCWSRPRRGGLLRSAHDLLGRRRSRSRSPSAASARDLGVEAAHRGRRADPADALLFGESQPRMVVSCARRSCRRGCASSRARATSRSRASARYRRRAHPRSATSAGRRRALARGWRRWSGPGRCRRLRDARRRARCPLTRAFATNAACRRLRPSRGGEPRLPRALRAAAPRPGVGRHRLVATAARASSRTAASGWSPTSSPRTILRAAAGPDRDRPQPLLDHRARATCANAQPFVVEYGRGPTRGRAQRQSGERRARSARELEGRGSIFQSHDRTPRSSST